MPTNSLSAYSILNTMAFYIRSIDLFGVEFKPTFFGNQKHKSITGSIITVILIILSLFKAYSSFSIIYDKEKFTVSQNTVSSQNEPIFFENFTFFICVNESHFDAFDFSLSFEKDGILAKSVRTGEEVLDYLDFNVKCKSFDVTGLYLTSNPYVKYMADIKLIAQLLNPKVESNVYLVFNYTYVDIRSYAHSQEKRTKIVNCGRIVSFSKGINIYFDSLNVIHQEIIKVLFFDFSHVKEEKSIGYYGVEKTDDIGNGNKLIITIKHRGWQKNYTFVSYDLEDILSDIGGFLNLWILVCSFLGNIINHIGLTNKINLFFRNNHYFLRKRFNIKDNTVTNSQNNNNNYNYYSLSPLKILNSKFLTKGSKKFLSPLKENITQTENFDQSKSNLFVKNNKTEEKLGINNLTKLNEISNTRDNNLISGSNKIETSKNNSNNMVNIIKIKKKKKVRNNSNSSVEKERKTPNEELKQRKNTCTPRNKISSQNIHLISVAKFLKKKTECLTPNQAIKHSYSKKPSFTNQMNKLVHQRH